MYRKCLPLIRAFSIMELPSFNQVLTILLKDLEKLGPEVKDPTVSGNSSLTIDSLPEPIQNSLLALHQIFPHLLLSSLDILDNTLATRYTVAQSANASPSIYYVRSS